jgi:hypothetical protein
MVIIVCNYPADLNWPPLLHRDFLPFLSTLWQAITATETAMVITAPRRAQIRNRRRPEIIMVGNAVVITHIIPRTPPPRPLAQTFHQLRHRRALRHRVRRSSLRLHLPQHHKSQREIYSSGSEQNFAAAFVFVPDVRSGLKLDSLNQSTLGLWQMRQIA